jgi:transposase
VENKRERRSFDKEFKKEVVHLVTGGGRKVSEVARDLDIHPNVIHRWKREYLGDTEDAFPGKGRMKPEGEETRKLKKTLADVTEERDILKKALAIFSKHPR